MTSAPSIDGLPKTRFWRTMASMGLLAGATIGAGVFTLPYVASRVGLPLFVVYLGVLGAFVGGTHLLYWRVLQRTGGTARLVGLARQHLGRGLARLAFLAIFLGAAFTLAIYILLGGHFLARVFPLPPDLASLLFWVGVSIPIAFGLRRFIRVELFIVVLMVLAALGVVFTQHLSLHALPFSARVDFFFPFGPLLFALAGWTSIEPIVLRYWRPDPARAPHPARTLAIGTTLIGILYAVFVIGIASISTTVTADTFSGLSAVPVWYLVLLFLFGLCALVTSYLPISHEVKNALVEDLKWSRSFALPAVLFFPYVLILIGLDNFLVLVGFVGGLFLAVQYLIILLLARVVLQPRGWRGVALDALWVVFVLAIAYQFYYLLV